MPKVLSNLVFLSGVRLKGLITPLTADEPRRLGDPVGNVTRRILSNTSASGTIACHWESYDEIRLTLVGNTTLTFSDPLDGKGCILVVKQDGVGGMLLTLPGSVRFSTDLPSYVATPTPSKQDRVGFIFNATDAKYDFVSVVKAFA